MTSPEHPKSSTNALRTAEEQRDAAEESRDRFAFLAEVSRCLAESLDYETTLTTVAGMSLPYLGAWCIVDLVEDGGGIRRLAVLHPDPAKQETARDLHRRYPPRGLGAAGAALLREITAATAEFVQRVRADARLRVSEAMTDVEVADHSATLLADIANSLVVLGEASGQPTEALGDGAGIQHLIGELHGAQRQRLGWTEEELLREIEIVRDVCAAAIGRVVGEDPQAWEVGALALSRLLDERRRACLVGFRSAAATVA